MVLKKGQVISIKVIEPFKLAYGEILGPILDVKNSNSLLIKLKDHLQGNKISGDIVELHSRTANEHFDTLAKRKSILANGALVKLGTDEFEFVFIGRVSLVK